MMGKGENPGRIKRDFFFPEEKREKPFAETIFFDSSE